MQYKGRLDVKRIARGARSLKDNYEIISPATTPAGIARDRSFNINLFGNALVARHILVTGFWRAVGCAAFDVYEL